MLTPRIGLVSVAAACVIAAGTGAYVATRQLNAPAQAEHQAPVPVQVAPVHETEAVLDEPVPAEELAPAEPVAVPPPAPAPPAAARPAPRPAERATPPPPARRSARASTPAPPQRTQSPPRTERAPVPDTAADIDRTSAPERYEPVTVPDLPVRTESARAPQREFQELVVEADSVVGLQFENTVTSETAQMEDRVSARVSRDVTVDGRIAIPAGSRMLGAVTFVDQGGKVKERARLGVRFHTLVLADGTSVPIQTETVYRDGESPANTSAAKIGGGAIGGAIIGGILGGARGAVIGGSTGAAGGTAAVMAGGRRAATIAAGSSMTVRVLSPVTVTVER